MASISLNHWQTRRREALDEIEAAHAAVGGVGPGRRYATQQINQAYAVLLSSQFQGFCRDLHSEAVDRICGPSGGGNIRLEILRARLMTGRRLDTGNPNPGNLGHDFRFFHFDLWSALEAQDPQNAHRQRVLLRLNNWRNAIAHQHFDPAVLDNRATIHLRDVRQWRRVCDRLAIEIDAVLGARIEYITGIAPW